MQTEASMKAAGKATNETGKEFVPLRMVPCTRAISKEVIFMDTDSLFGAMVVSTLVSGQKVKWTDWEWKSVQMAPFDMMVYGRKVCQFGRLQPVPADGILRRDALSIRTNSGCNSSYVYIV